MRIAFTSVVCGSVALLTGCTVHTHREVVVEERRPVYVERRVVERPVVEAEIAVEPEAPVIVDAAPTGILRIDVEPAPIERVYVYEPGFPPGCYLYGGFYYYGGYRYHHDVFIHRYVEVNVRERRYVNVVENRRVGHTIEVRHKTEFVRYGEHHDSHPSVKRAVETKTVAKTVHTEPKTVHTEPKTVKTVNTKNETHVADGHKLKAYEDRKTVTATEKKKVVREEDHR